MQNIILYYSNSDKVKVVLLLLFYIFIYTATDTQTQLRDSTSTWNTEKIRGKNRPSGMSCIFVDVLVFFHSMPLRHHSTHKTDSLIDTILRNDSGYIRKVWIYVCTHGDIIFLLLCLSYRVIFIHTSQYLFSSDFLVRGAMLTCTPPLLVMHIISKNIILCIFFRSVSIFWLARHISQLLTRV